MATAAEALADITAITAGMTVEYGAVPDLFTAMSMDATLKQMVKDLSATPLDAANDNYQLVPKCLQLLA